MELKTTLKNNGAVVSALYRFIGVVALLLSFSGGFARQPPVDAIVGTRITVKNFSIDTTEVTIGQFQRNHSPDDKTTKAEKEGGGYEYSDGWVQRQGWYWYAPYGEKAGTNEPVVHLTWFEARDHCHNAGGRLPRFKEWQSAAYKESRDNPTDSFIQGRSYDYPVGEKPDGMNTSAADPWPRHATVGSTRRGVNGLYDMGANVWEWLADEQGDRALTAGGSWWYGAEKTRAEGAQFKPKEFAAVYIGFRCVYSVKTR